VLIWTWRAPVFDDGDSSLRPAVAWPGPPGSSGSATGTGTIP